jgi:hypothetical protein
MFYFDHNLINYFLKFFVFIMILSVEYQEFDYDLLYQDSYRRDFVVNLRKIIL